MNRITVKAKVGSDGVLRLSLPLGPAEADQDVQITIEPAAPWAMSPEEWRRGIWETAGKWQGELERPDQGEYEQRDLS